MSGPVMHFPANLLENQTRGLRGLGVDHELTTAEQIWSSVGPQWKWFIWHLF